MKKRVISLYNMQGKWINLKQMPINMFKLLKINKKYDIF